MAWNELHYARAAEFARLIADLSAPAIPAVARAIPEKAPAPPVFRTIAPATPPPVAAPSPKPAVPPPAGPTAASVFNKIPWKK